MSDAAQQELFTKITTDFEFFFNTLTIVNRDFTLHPSKDVIKARPMTLAKHQKELIQYLDRGDIPEYTVLKSRQVGVTTVLVALILWNMQYNRDQNYIYMMDLEAKTLKIANMLKEMYYSIPDFLRVPLDIKKSNVITNIANNNTLQIHPARQKHLRSDTFTLGIFDEFAFYEAKDQHEIDQAAISSCPTRIFLSTPKVQDDLFEHKCIEAERRGQLYKRSILDIPEWYGGEDNAAAWLSHSTQNKPQSMINREYLCEFKGAATDTIWETEDYMFGRYKLDDDMFVVSLDLGWKDDTCILAAALTPDGLHFTDEIIVNHRNVKEIANLITGLQRPFKFGIADSSSKKVDMTGGLSVWSELKKHLGIPIYTRKLPDKVKMLNIVQSALYRQVVKIDQYRCPNLTKMMMNYEWGRAKASFPHNDYSHIHDAFVYGVLNWLLIKQDLKPKHRLISAYDW